MAWTTKAAVMLTVAVLSSIFIAKRLENVWSLPRNRHVVWTSNTTRVEDTAEVYKHLGSRFLCSVEKPSSYVPAQSVHALTPHDVQVVAGIGDSVTAALAVGAKSFLTFPFDYRGLSWSTGGDKDLRRVVTFPNILKQYNPALTGYSTGVSFAYSKNLNVAISGVTSSQTLNQAERIVKKMDAMFGDRKSVDSKWKVITIMMGLNDMCSDCWGTAQDHAADYLENVKKALDYLSANVRRAFVNLVLPPDPSIMIIKSSGLSCFLPHLIACPCLTAVNLTMGPLKQRLFGEYLHQLIADKDHYNREDFTVVIQPLFYNSRLYETYYEYFAIDCSHFNERGQSLAAIQLWNNMLEPLGAKTDNMDFYKDPYFRCPSALIGDFIC